MATSSLIPVSEYLANTYRPDCEYIDGEVQERNLGELDHSDLQSRLIELLRTPQNKTQIHANSELRVQVKETRFRVPDVCVRSIAAPREQVICYPPLLCIEIVSPRDTISAMRERVRDFLDMGVPQVWLVDPATRTVIVCNDIQMIDKREGRLTVPRTTVELSIAEIFSPLAKL
jgi:Uma2 family endonuclease